MSLAISFLWKFRSLVLCGLLVAAIAGWRWDHNRLTDQVGSLTQDVEMLTDKADSFAKVNTNLISRISDLNKQIEKLVTDGESLRVELSGKARQFEAEKRDLLKQIAALPPLPADCDGAVRETARSLKAMTGGE